jgi:hypothetical protein
MKRSSQLDKAVASHRVGSSTVGKSRIPNPESRRGKAATAATAAISQTPPHTPN